MQRSGIPNVEKRENGGGNTNFFPNESRPRACKEQVAPVLHICRTSGAVGVIQITLKWASRIYAGVKETKTEL